MCGPSQAQKNLSGEQGNFFNELTNAYHENFGAQQGILSQLQSTLAPIFNAGPNQQGFSPAENAALTGAAINNTAGQARNAQVIAASSEGGNTGVTTGGEKQLQAGIASRAGQNLSGQENQINLANYATGRQNFYNAEAGLSGVAQAYNPNATASVANTAGGQAFNEATQVNQEQNQMEADIAGFLSPAAGMALQGGAGNLDQTGGSSGGEQLSNFFSGALMGLAG